MGEHDNSSLAFKAWNGEAAAPADWSRRIVFAFLLVIMGHF